MSQKSPEAASADKIEPAKRQTQWKTRLQQILLIILDTRIRRHFLMKQRQASFQFRGQKTNLLYPLQLMKVLLLVKFSLRRYFHCSESILL